MTNRAEELITQLEADIVKRDARIAELEAQAGEGTSSNKYRAELYDEVWQTARDMGYGNVIGALQELSALKARPSAGVVLPDLIAELKKQAEEIARKGHAGWGNTMLSAAEALSVAGVVLPERESFEAWVKLDWPQAPLSRIRDLLPASDPRYGEYCDERLQRAWIGWQARARLNPCRAQAVPDGYVLVPVEPTPAMILAYNVHGAEAGDPLRRGPPRNLNVVAYKDMIAAAPSSEKESK